MTQDCYLTTGETVGLRPVTNDDAALLRACWRAENKRPRSWLQCVVVSLADEAPAGIVSLGAVTAGPELVVMLLPGFRGRGIGTEAARLIIDYGFTRMGIASVGGGALDSNVASRRMLEKLGFERAPAGDARSPSKWAEGEVTELGYRLDRTAWLRGRMSDGPVTPCIFDARPALDTIRGLDLIRVCGSDGERQAVEVVTRKLDEIGVAWHYHTFRDWWLEPDDPHLVVRGRKLRVRPVMELSFQSAFEFMSDDGLHVDVAAPLAPTSDCAGKIAVAREFDPDRPVEPEAAAQLMAFPFDPHAEAYLWGQKWDIQKAPCAWVAPEDIQLVAGAVGEAGTLRWGATKTEREFRNLVAEIPGTEKPDEIVVMGAHIDSFPGTVGSADDAAGCAILLEAARWFAANPPGRTVRLIWFTGEELDARGSKTYVKQRIEDSRAIKLMVNVDSGCEMYTGPLKVYASDESTIQWARERIDIGGVESFVTESKFTDAGAFIAAGVPALMVEAPSKQPAHLPDDRPENIDPHKLQVIGSLSLHAAMLAAQPGM